MNSLSAVARLYVVTVTANLILLAVVVRAYASCFALLMDPFSWLGKLFTSDGSANVIAMFIFSGTLLLNALVWRQFVSLMSRGYLFATQAGFRLLGQMVQAGFVLMAFPCDIFVITHSVGGGFVVGGLWAFTTGMLYQMRGRLGPVAYICFQLFLHVSAIFCGVTFVLDSPLKGFSQRPLLIAILAETGICLNILVRARLNHGLGWYLRHGPPLSWSPGKAYRDN